MEYLSSIASAFRSRIGEEQKNLKNKLDDDLNDQSITKLDLIDSNDELESEKSESDDSFKNNDLMKAMDA